MTSTAKSNGNTNGSSRSSRLSTLSNGSLHDQYNDRYRHTNGNGHANGHPVSRLKEEVIMSDGGASPGTMTPRGTHFARDLTFLGPRLHNLAIELEDRLETQSEKPGWGGRLARELIDRGMWLEEHIEEEIDMRLNAIGGLDNMWILLSSISSFNPVCAATYTFKQPTDLETVYKVTYKQVETFPKYKQILSNTGRRWHGSVFVDDPNWDVKKHVFMEHLPEPAGRKELDDYVSDRAIL